MSITQEKIAVKTQKFQVPVGMRRDSSDSSPDCTYGGTSAAEELMLYGVMRHPGGRLVWL